MTRLYLPTTLDGLRAGLAAGRITPGAGTVVVEPAASGGSDDEEEYAALMSAADASAALLDGPGRRVVVVAELAAGGDAAHPVPWKRVVAVHADPVDRPAGADPDEDLAWYATQEIPDLV